MQFTCEAVKLTLTNAMFRVLLWLINNWMPRSYALTTRESTQ